MIIINRICIHEEFKRKLRQVNAFLPLIQIFFFLSTSSFFSVVLRPDFTSWSPLTGFAFTLIRHTTLGRTPLDVWSARHRDLWQHTTLTRDGHSCPRRESKQQS